MDIIEQLFYEHYLLLRNTQHNYSLFLFNNSIILVIFINIYIYNSN